MRGAEIGVFHVDVREQPAGSRDDDIGTLNQCGFLLVKSGSHSPAVNGQGGGSCKIGEPFDLLVNLQNQLPRWGDDQGMHAGVSLPGDVVQNREQIGCCLSGTRLGTGNQVFPL